MANLCTAFIPIAKIERIQIYMNTSRRKTLADIKKETGADYVLNGTLYNMSTGDAVCHLKAGGKPICSPAYSVHGYAWNTAADFGMELLPNVPKSGNIGKQNYISCTPLIIDGIPLVDPCKNPGLQGKRGRTAIGMKDGCLALYCSKDGFTAARTPNNLRDDLHTAGWDNAVMLDGGGSSQCDFLGDKIKSSRKVAHLILVYLKKDACPFCEPTKTVKRGSCGSGAKWVQWMLNKWHPGLDVDGIFGKASASALVEFQRAHGLVADGLCGVKTRTELKK
jgi:peptidoglycan hydrolase-like protein with peptidoglycan-binding domain